MAHMIKNLWVVATIPFQADLRASVPEGRQEARIVEKQSQDKARTFVRILLVILSIVTEYRQPPLWSSIGVRYCSSCCC